MIETLAQKVCTPCRGGIPPLTPEEVARYASQLPGWAVKDEARRIERMYRFGNFREALALVVRSGHWRRRRAITRMSASVGAMRPSPFRPRRSKACTRTTSSWPPRSTNSRHPWSDRTRAALSATHVMG
jgi:hypothetical protein